MNETLRPFTQAERRLLQRRGAMPEIGSVYWMRNERVAFAWTLGICGAIIAIGSLWKFQVTAWLAAFLFASSRFGGYRDRCRIRKHMQDFRRRLAEELEEGKAYVIACRPKRVFEREEIEDEGKLWIFDDGDGSYLALCGQDFDEAPRFPSTFFEVVLGGRHKTLIGIRNRGVRFPSHTVVPVRELPCKDLPVRDITLFAAAPDAEFPAIFEALLNVKEPARAT